jgi:hypothetical protein
MQAELVMMVAPVIPCYRLNVICVTFVTFAIMVAGYCASLMSGDLWNGSLEDFLSTWDLEDLALTQKAYVLMPSMVGISILTFVQLPFLAILYTVKGGVSAGLPYNYRKLLLVVGMTWLTFPVWWFLNWQGMSVITDAKLNGAGFCLLNVISKGLFTFTVLSSMRWHKSRGWSTGPKSEKEGTDSTGTNSLRSQATISSRSTRYLPAEIPWFVHVLLPFDTFDECSEESVARILGEGQFQLERKPSKLSKESSPESLRGSQWSSKPTIGSVIAKGHSYYNENVGRLLERVERLCDVMEIDGLGMKTPLPFFSHPISPKGAYPITPRCACPISPKMGDAAVDVSLQSSPRLSSCQKPSARQQSADTRETTADGDDLEHSDMNLSQSESALDALSSQSLSRHHIANTMKSSESHIGHSCIETSNRSNGKSEV